MLDLQRAAEAYFFRCIELEKGFGERTLKQLGAKFATEIFASGASSEAWQQGRRLKLFFVGQKPELDRIEFHANNQQGEKYGFLQRGFHLTQHSFKWTEMPQALARFFLEYLNTGLHGRGFDFRRVPQTGTLADAVVKNNSKLYTLFVESLPEGGTADRVDLIFDGDNLHGRNPEERSVRVKTGYLPFGCVEVYWERRPLTKPKEMEAFTQLFLKAWGMSPLAEPELPVGEESPEPKPPRTETVKPSPVPELPPQSKTEDPPRQPEPEPEPPKVTPPTQGAEPVKECAPDYPLPPPIDPQFFTVKQSGGYWPDDAPLIELPTEEDVHTWTLKNAFEGVLILGRTGSGKTSGSGFTFAEAFLRAGFGGLVLTCKKNEAAHWRRLCAYCGREKDIIVVQRGGQWKLNVLAYEAQHPGQGAGLSENLTSFCRNLLRISSRSRGPQHQDQVWEQAGDQLLNATFDLFLLAGGGISFDRLADFVAAAPTDTLPTTEADWLKIPVFGSVFLKAQKSIGNAEDERIFRRATGYWFKIFADYPSRLRSSVTLGIYAMFDAFRGRDVPALISSETNVTPESIMSGKIVVVDLPLKELRHTGLMVQSAWKYLFQTALERQDGANSPHRRPVFLWEDEAQYFFSDHDHHFQDTARSSRVSRVVLTQNLHSFYKEFGKEGVEITNSVFGNLNTKVFHNNSDPMTNEWAAKHFGMEIHTRYSFNSAPTPQPKDFFDGLRQSIDPSNTTSVSGKEAWEYAVRPEEFNTLRTGGPDYDFIVDAWITWMGLSAERQRHFTLMSFQQNPEL